MQKDKIKILGIYWVRDYVRIDNQIVINAKVEKNGKIKNELKMIQNKKIVSKIRELAKKYRNTEVDETEEANTNFLSNVNFAFHFEKTKNVEFQNALIDILKQYLKYKYIIED